jgi:hypothetical protein
MVKPNLKEFVNATESYFQEYETYVYAEDTSEIFLQGINSLKNLYKFIYDNVSHTSYIYHKEHEQIVALESEQNLDSRKLTRDRHFIAYDNLFDYFNTTGTWTSNQSKQRLLDIEHKIKDCDEQINRIEIHHSYLEILIMFYIKAKKFYDGLSRLPLPQVAEEHLEIMTTCKNILVKCQDKIDTHFHNELTVQYVYPLHKIVQPTDHGRGTRIRKKRKNNKTKRRKQSNRKNNK